MTNILIGSNLKYEFKLLRCIYIFEQKSKNPERDNLKKPLHFVARYISETPVSYRKLLCPSATVWLTKQSLTTTHISRYGALARR